MTTQLVLFIGTQTAAHIALKMVWFIFYIIIFHIALTIIVFTL